MNTLFIYGASGHAKVIAETAELQHRELEINFLDDDANKKECLGLSVIHQTENFSKYKGSFVIGVGLNHTRKAIVENIEKEVSFSEPIIHFSAILSKSSKVGLGSVIFANAVINAEVKIGKHVIINTSSVIEHDCIIEDFVHVAPGALLAGNVTVGEGTFVGLGAKIIQGVTIGDWCTIGAGAVIIKDIPDGTKVVGVPGRHIK